MAKFPRFTRCLECHKTPVTVVFFYRVAEQVITAPFCSEHCLTTFIERKKNEGNPCHPAGPQGRGQHH